MDKFLKLCITTIILLSISLPVFAKENESENAFLYSQEYFDYLIECASIEKNELEANKELDTQENFQELNYNAILQEESLISDEYEPFKLHIQANSEINPYKETFKKEDSKTTIMIGDKLSVIQDMSKIKNKYNSNDYRVLAGLEYSPFKFFKISTGLETNYRGQDQNPNSRKIYFTPSFYITDKISLSFYNKMNVTTKASDYDIGLNISPFKEKFMDFGVYAGTTRYQTGSHSESINFRTNLYFF